MNKNKKNLLLLFSRSYFYLKFYRPKKRIEIYFSPLFNLLCHHRRLTFIDFHLDNPWTKSFRSEKKKKKEKRKIGRGESSKEQLKEITEKFCEDATNYVSQE